MVPEAQPHAAPIAGSLTRPRVLGFASGWIVWHARTPEKLRARVRVDRQRKALIVFVQVWVRDAVNGWMTLCVSPPRVGPRVHTEKSSSRTYRVLRNAHTSAAG